ncbi:MAG: alpha/beta fold hydrolase [Actinobacteria bacterium]|nr:alpha/beta fold hydrolase [Actinomycetota bacterium]
MEDIRIIYDVRYMSRREGSLPPLLDVYAPKQGGPWPLVVMLHGGGLDTCWMGDWAAQVAQRGAVVFVPEWSRVLESELAAITAAESRASQVGQFGDVAAAVRFARGTGARYGGDPAHLTLFGHSAGAMQAASEAFSGAPASEGGLEGAGSTLPESLVLLDGDWMIIGDPMWNRLLAEDPGIMQVATPWQYVGRRVDFPVTVINSGDPYLSVPLGDPWAKDSWLVARDPSGKLRRGLEKLGAFRGHRFANDYQQALFAQRLRAAGDAVTFVTLKDSSHTELSPEGMTSLLEALVPGT